MLEQCGPERSWHILSLRRLAEQSSLVVRSESIRGDGERESVIRDFVSNDSYLVMLIVP